MFRTDRDAPLPPEARAFLFKCAGHTRSSLCESQRRLSTPRRPPWFAATRMSRVSSRFTWSPLIAGGRKAAGGADESGALFFHLGRSNELFYNKRRGGWQPRTGTVSGGVPVRQVNGRSDAPSRGRQIKALDSNASLRM